MWRMDKSPCQVLYCNSWHPRLSEYLNSGCIWSDAAAVRLAYFARLLRSLAHKMAGRWVPTRPPTVQTSASSSKSSFNSQRVRSALPLFSIQWSSVSGPIARRRALLPKMSSPGTLQPVHWLPCPTFFYREPHTHATLQGPCRIQLSI